jgi:hypothetical protein
MIAEIARGGLAEFHTISAARSIRPPPLLASSERVEHPSAQVEVSAVDGCPLLVEARTRVALRDVVAGEDGRIWGLPRED